MIRCKFSVSRQTINCWAPEIPTLRLLFLVSVLLNVSGKVSESPWSPEIYPNPKVDVDKCGRGGKASSICDPDRVLSLSAANRVDGVLKEIFEGSDPYIRAPCGDKGLEGFQVGVALMKSMRVADGETPASQAAKFAEQLHDDWGVGDEECNNGVLLVLAIQERQVYISTGAGAAKHLTASCISSVIAAMRPLLRKANYDDAIEQAVVDIGLGLAGGRAESEGGIDWFAVSFFGVIALLLGNTCRRSWLRRREYRDCKRMLVKLKREQEQVRTHAWSAPPSCPICLEDFNPPPSALKGGPASAPVECKDKAGPSATPGASEDASPSAPLLPMEGITGQTQSGGSSGSGSSTRRRSVSRGLEEICAGAGEGGSAGDSGRGGSKPCRPPITLVCGHTFCDPCLTRWLQQKTTCPICRDKIANSGESPRHDNMNSTAGGEAQHANRMLLNDFWAMELAFRLGSLQRMYPAFVSPSMADQWAAEARESGTFNWESTRAFQLRDPGMRAQHEVAGSSGFSSSFGGGTSLGGGGGGGSW